MHLAHSILDKFRFVPFRKRIHPTNAADHIPCFGRSPAPKCDTKWTFCDRLFGAASLFLLKMKEQQI